MQLVTNTKKPSKEHKMLQRYRKLGKHKKSWEVTLIKDMNSEAKYDLLRKQEEVHHSQIVVTH